MRRFISLKTMKNNLFPGEHFESLIGKILNSQGFSVQDAPSQTFDFLAIRNGETWAIEAKYYRTERAQLSLIETAAVQLIRRAIIVQENQKHKIYKGMLVISSLIPLEVKHELERRYNLFLVDRTDLFFWASSDSELLNELTSLLESYPKMEPITHGRELLITASETSLLPESPPSISTVERDLAIERGLLNDLENLPKGNEAWSAYEELCYRILHHLFSNHLEGWCNQQRTDDGLNRFDCVCRIKPATAFWQFLIDQLNSRYIIFEFKNYKEKIRQGEVLTTEKYLFEKALRRVAVILTRAGANQSAKAAIQGAMREHGKLMLVINDGQVRKMIEKKIKGGDPSDLLFGVVDEFLMSLSR